MRGQHEPGEVGRGQITNDIVGYDENLGLYSKKKWEAI